MTKKYILTTLVGLIKPIFRKVFNLKKKYYISSEPYLDPTSLKYFYNEIDKCTLYIEYGSGGSTLYVGNKNKKVVSVENDYDFYNFLKTKICNYYPNVNLLYVNTGIVGSYGIPIFKSPTSININKWKSYVQAPWKVIYNQTPDLIFIDGRFRVACALYSIIMMRDYPKTKILIDDYLNRPEYKIIENYAKFIGIKGRIGFFTIPKIFDKKIYSVIEDYYSNWL